MDDVSLSDLLAELPHKPQFSLVHGPLAAPVLFLLDEDHGSPDTIEQNIDVARALLEQGMVRLVGVEDYYAENDLYDGELAQAVSHPPSQLPHAAHAPAPSPFAMRIFNAGWPVVGVDSEGWETEFLMDPGVGPVGAHPAQRGRSMHFLRSLLAQLAKQSELGNVLLNCGSNHNEHILEAARATEKPTWWPPLTVVRLRVPAHP
jgi:hypothetical protein